MACRIRPPAVAVVCLGAAATAAACGGGAAKPLSAGDGSLVAIIKGLDNPFFGTMRDGLVAQAGRARVRLRVEAAAGQSDAAGQASRLDSQAGSGASCYVVNPINQANLIQPLSRVAAGTPIVNIDSPVSRTQAAAIGVHITTYIGTDNAAAGRAAADAIAGAVTRGARVAVLTGPPGDATSDARISGFRRGVAGRFKVVASAAADFDRRKAELAATDLLQADSGLAGVFAANDLMALGAAKAVKGAGHGRRVAVVGVDGIRESLAAIRSGAMSATVAQYPYTMGQLGVQACLAAARSKPVPSRIDAPIQVITRGNVARAQASFPKPIEHFANPLGAG
jgi:ABC-type sugar transport system substrate-binding protein